MPLSPQATTFDLYIGAVERTSLLRQGSISVNMRLNQRWDASFELFDEDGSVAAQEGQNVILREYPPSGGGPYRCFYGKLDSVEEVRAVDNSLGSELFVRCQCVDLMSRLDQRSASEPATYRDQTAGWFVNSALSNWAASEGITFALVGDGGYINDGAAVTKYTFNKQVLLDVMEDMCQRSDFVAFIDVDGNFHFEQAGASYAAPFSISATSANFTRITKRRSKGEGGGSAGSGYFNQSWTRTSWAAWEQRHDTFIGDGSTVEWTLAYEAAVVVDVKINGKSVDFGGEEEGRAYTWLYGENRLIQDGAEAVLTVADTIEVWYHSMDQGFIFVQDLAEIAARGAIEGNTGQMARIFDDSQETNFDAATEKAQAKLDIAKHIVEQVTLEANGFGPLPIFPRPGMLFSASLSYPSISGNFIILEVSAREVAGAGLKYTCKCVKQGSSRRLSNGIDYFRELARKKPGTTIAGGAGDGGPKSGPVPYRLLINNSAVRDRAANSVNVYGALIKQASRIRRIQAVLTRTITSDLTVRFTVYYSASESHIIGEFTIPSGTVVDTTVEFVEFEHDLLPDRSVLVSDITASDGSKNADGIASFLIEAVGRGSGLVTAAGMANLDAYQSDTEYSTGDITAAGGVIYISLEDGNLGNDPATSPGQWQVLVEGTAGTITIGTVTTGAAGSSASVTNVGTDSDAILDFSIPRGDTGATGATGATGPAIVTTKGDLATFDSAVARLAVGSNGQILEADSAQSKGIKWAAPPGSVQVDGTLIGTRKILDLVAGLGVTLSASDDGTRVIVTINASGGGGGGSSAAGSGAWSAVSSGGGSVAW